MKKLIVANLKMNPQTIKEAEQFFGDVLDSTKKIKNTEIIICPPFVYLESLSKMLHASRFKLQVKIGAQDVFWENKGPYTGEISTTMLKSLGTKYVIVGHSERRRDLGETDEMINKKIKMALKHNLKVIFCVGEERRDERGDYLKFVKKELLNGLGKIARKDFKNLIIVYEPIWAISSQKNAQADTPENLFQMGVYIRRALFFKFGRKIARETPILYGGSVNAKNARDFLERGKAQGLLVGHASLKVDSFIKLLENI